MANSHSMTIEIERTANRQRQLLTNRHIYDVVKNVFNAHHGNTYSVQPTNYGFIGNLSVNGVSVRWMFVRI